MMRRCLVLFLIVAVGWSNIGFSPDADAAPRAGNVQHAESLAEGQECTPGGICTHGPDRPPAGFVPEPAQPVFNAAATDTRAVCDGDGVSGPRFQVVYMYSGTDRYSAFSASFRLWAKNADLNYQASARRTGGERYVRYVHDANCVISIKKIKVPADLYATGGGYAVSRWMGDRGYKRMDRKYLIFTEDTDVNACGVGLQYYDDSPGLNNSNNRAPVDYFGDYASIALVFGDCWQSPTVVAHEMAHTLGAVQSSAPHYDDDTHCTDDYDVMCYDGFYPIVCPGYENNVLLDCNNDDYFHTNPPTGNYLKTHWNLADSEFLGRPVPKVTLDKTSSKFNGVVKVSLVRFAPNRYINIKWADGTLLASVKSKSDGTATTTFRTPLVPLGNYTVTASNSSGDVANTTLRVIPRIMLNETRGEAGMSIRVYFYGFAPGDKVEVRFWNTAGTSSQLLTTITIASNGRGTKVVNVPTKTTVGKHKIVGKVLGVGRSASTTFTVTSMGTAEEPTATATSTPSPTATVTSTIEPTITPSAEPTETPDVVTEMPTNENPTEIASPEVPTETPEVDASTETATPEPPTETAVPSESPTQEPTETPMT